MGIYIITIDNLSKIEAYCDTALYVELIKTNKGFVVGGNIDDKAAAKLSKCFSEIPVFERSKKLLENQACMYCDNKWSIITIN